MKRFIKKIIKKLGLLHLAINLYFKLKNFQNLKVYYCNKTPEMVTWAITGGCNSKCIFCEVPWQLNCKNDLSKEKVFEIIDEMKAVGVKQVHLVGGEVFIRRDIFDILKYLKSKGISIYITTNGLRFRFFSEEQLKIIKETVSTIAFSLDSTDKNQYEKIRGIPGCFDNMLKAIRITKKLGSINIIIGAVVTKDTIPEIPKLVKLGAELGVDYVSFQPLSPITIFAETRAKEDKINLMPKNKNDLENLTKYIDLGIKESKNKKIETSLSNFKTIAIPYFNSFME